MRNIIIAALLVSGSLVAAESVDVVDVNKSGSFSSTDIDGAALFMQRCAICHGEKATNSPEKKVIALAGMDATRLALRIKSYRDQNDDVGTYTVHKTSQVMRDSTKALSNEQISAIATYVSGLK